MTRLERLMKDANETLEVIEVCLNKFEYTLNELKEWVLGLKDDMQGLFNMVINKVDQENEALEAMMVQRGDALEPKVQAFKDKDGSSQARTVLM
ncbi:hypothetical protein V6N11_081951 [Hibiscus sabdariffa]|uniref:Uncharacterized protein n=1 Tax=Hibiscus sabdariffa TaxID=183260 RepID=A0ABR2Q7P1_9ROSI